MSKYKKGDILVESGMGDDPLRYSIVLRELAPERYLVGRIQLDYSYDVLSSGTIDTWYEPCDHKVTKFKEELTPKFFEEQLDWKM